MTVRNFIITYRYIIKRENFYRMYKKMKTLVKTIRYYFYQRNWVRVILIHRNEARQNCKSIKLKFIRLDFTNLRHQRANSIRDRLNLSARTFHIHVWWQIAMTDRSIRLILWDWLLHICIQLSVASILLNAILRKIKS